MEEPAVVQLEWAVEPVRVAARVQEVTVEVLAPVAGAVQEAEIPLSGVLRIDRNSQLSFKVSIARALGAPPNGVSDALAKLSTVDSESVAWGA